ncbi:MAG: hypothetical protein ACI88A_001656 [Paraglaciecola sp.]|jgi:hypothetical protein
MKVIFPLILAFSLFGGQVSHVEADIDKISPDKAGFSAQRLARIAPVM